ncbi:MAG: hypothetical protein RLZZ618_1840 [Pseudomonadota bacterium]|jgi:hypothetical protein
MKYVLIAAFVLILVALASAGILMLRDGRNGKAKSNNMARALAVRVGLSVAVFLLIMLSYALGWIEPTGIRVGR